MSSSLRACRGVVIVDDDPHAREALHDHFKGEGFRNIYTFDDGEAALEHLKVRGACVIVSDLYMPRMGGSALFQACRAIPELRFVPFVVLSADPMSGAEEGMYALEGKPVNLSRLYAYLSAYCHNPREMVWPF